MCDEVVDIEPWSLKYVPDHLKIQRTCDKAVRKDVLSLQYVSDWFVLLQEMWYEDFDDDDNDDDDNDDVLIKWYERYQKRKAQKAQIKKELMPIAWHPSRYLDWRMSEDEKRDTEKLWA